MSVPGWLSLGGKASRDPEVVSLGSNRLDVFVIGEPDGGGKNALLWKRWDGSGWKPSLDGPWHSLGNLGQQEDLTRLAVVSPAPGRIEIIGLGHQSIYRKWWDGSSWQPSELGWEDLGFPSGVPLFERPALVGLLNVFLLLFCKGFDGQLYWRQKAIGGTEIGAWENWGSKLDPAVTSDGPGRVQLLVGDSNHVVSRKWYDFRLPTSSGEIGWQPADWESLGTGMVEPKAVSWEPGRLDVFATSINPEGIVHKSILAPLVWTSSQTDWENLGGTDLSHLRAVSWGPGRLDLVGRRPTYLVAHKWWDGSQWQPSQTDWASLEGYFYLSHAPAVVSWGANRVDVFVRATDNPAHDVGDSAVYTKWFNGSEWTADL